LLGRPFLAKIEAKKPGHALNQKLVKAILANADHYVLIESPEARSLTC